MNDLRFAWRQLGKHPFTNGVIVLTIALLIGTVSVIYASLQNDQRRYAPFPEPERVVKLWRVGQKQFDQTMPILLFEEYRSRLASYEELGALVWRQAMTLTELGEPVSYNVVDVTPGGLRVTRIAPLFGRIFDDADLDSNENPILISETVWREKLGGDKLAVGRELRLNNKLHKVIGILPDSLRSTHLAFNVDIWQPLQPERGKQGTTAWIFGRLKDGVVLKQAQAELDIVAPAIEANHTPNDYERAVLPGGVKGVRVLPSDERLSNYRINTEVVFVWVFATAIIGSIVGISCFNVTNLLLARVGARSREIAIRISIGAARGRIVRQLLTETVLLAVLGGAFGLVVSFWLFDLFRLTHAEVRFDWRLYAITTGGTLLLGVLVGLAPALRSAHTDLNEALKDGSQAVGGRRRHRLRNFLVSSEIAMALVLCVIAGMTVRAYLSLYGAKLEMEPERVISISTDLRPDRYRTPDDRFSFAQRASQALSEMPGVEAAAITLNSGIFGWTTMRDLVTIGATTGDEQRSVQSDLLFASHGFASISGMRVLKGRDLASESSKGQEEALVNQEFVRQFFPSEDPIGKQICIAREKHWVTIVGVVKNRHPLTTYSGKSPEVLFHYQRSTFHSQIGLLVQTKGMAKPMAPSIREVIQGLDASQPVNQAIFLADLVKKRAAEPRTGILFLGSLAGAGLFIALMGVYGVVAFTVMERTREVGIRMALGATEAEVLRLMFWQGARLILLGAVPGLVIGSIIMGGLPRRGLGLDVPVFDPIAQVIVIAVVGLAGFIASVMPARKAARLDPMNALRHE